ncbi:MAG: delta-60 repeat domain-containing protein, partial [Chloroflexota bacterium]
HDDVVAVAEIGCLIRDAVALQPDGKILIAGINSFIQSAILRYNSDGTPDTSFGTNGQVTTSDTHIGGTVMLQTDGKIVATTGVGFRLSRYLSNGQLDTTFGTNGRVSSFFGGTSWANTAIKQTDGKVVIADTVNNNLTVARYIIEPATVYLPFIFVAASSDLE